MSGDAIEALADRIAALDLPEPIGVAVSGGSDSTALLLAARATGLNLRVATVNHGLRADAVEEARRVGALCTELGLVHTVLSIALDAGPNLQARAREARYGVLADWARGAGIETVLLGHTADDVAETLMMRLARGSGIDGLARMAAKRTDRGVVWHRPALDLLRSDLRSALTTRAVGWSDDPSNEDDAFTRIAARRAIATLGLDVPALAASAKALAAARDSLAVHAADLARAHVREDHGDLLIDRDALGRLNRTDPDPCSRILLGALHWIGGGPYGPRRDERERLLANVFEARPCTLGGCRLNHEGGTLRITREVAACAPPGPAAEVWDGRWHLTGPMADHLTVGALGEDIVATPWREAKLPRSSLLASPAIRDGTRLIAAPLAGLSKGWRAQTRLPFVLSLLER